MVAAQTLKLDLAPTFCRTVDLLGFSKEPHAQYDHDIQVSGLRSQVSGLRSQISDLNEGSAVPAVDYESKSPPV